MPMPVAGSLSNLIISTASTQSATGSLVVTARLGGVDTTLVATVPANSAAGAYVDLTHSAAIAANDVLTFSWANNASVGSAQAGYTSYVFTPTDPLVKGILIFPRHNVGLSASQTRYFIPFANSAVLTNPTDAEGGTPYEGGMTLGTGVCNVTTAPANNAVLTLYKNGVATAATLTLTNAGGTGVKSFSGGSITYTYKDRYTVEAVTGAGAQAVLSGCAFPIT
jgi:hypothetical protein